MLAKFALFLSQLEGYRFDEDNVLIDADQVETGRSTPLLLRWDIVSKCNLSCSHCCVGDLLRDETAVDLSKQEIFLGLENAAKGGVRQVHFLGGEPTIRKDFLEILEHARECRLAVSFNTNGIRQDKRYLDKLLEICPVGITISVDGPDAASHDAVRGKGTFARTIAFIKKLVEMRHSFNGPAPEIQIQAVLTAHWVARAGAILELANDLAVDAIVINHLAKIGDGKTNHSALGIGAVEHFDASLKLLAGMAKFPSLKVTAPIRLKVIQYYRELTGDRSAPLYPNDCPAIDENSQVNFDGSITPCQLAQEYGLVDTHNPPTILHDVDKAWNSPVFEAFKKVVKAPIEHVYEHQIPCNRCAFLGRGCKPCPMPDDPTLFKTNYQCLIAEALLHAGHEKGFVRDLSVDEQEIIKNITVERHEPRRRPTTAPLFTTI